MAFPVIRATNESAKTATTGTTHTVSLPTGIMSGDLLLVIISKGRATSAWSFDALTGWTELLDEAVAGGLYIAYRKADGSESSTIALTGAADRSAHITYCIAQAADPTTRPPEIGTVATGTSTGPDPSTTTPTGGTKDYLWITLFGTTSDEEADDDTWVNNAATNYGNLLQKTSGTGGTNVAAGVGTSTRTNRADSENAVWPAASLDTSMGWRAYTLAVHPVNPVTLKNYQFIKVGTGMGCSEKIK